MRPGGIFLWLMAVALAFLSFFAVIPAQAKTRVEVNIFYPGAAWNIGTLNGFQSNLGIKFSSAKWYMDWSASFDSGAAQTLQNNGYIPEMTWEPSISGTGVSYDQVVAGAYDAHITQTAQAVKNLGFPIRISLAPEMNATWTPWGGLPGNNPTNFKAFWQHVVQKFQVIGATNAVWIWSPNVVPYVTERVGTYAEMYPGNTYVDYMGLDGYNWGTSQSWSAWQSFREVFLGSYNEIIGVSSKDILIMEMASTEIGGSKAAWISDMYNELQNSFPRIKGFTWFHINKETDWRIDSSASAKASFIAGYHGVAVAQTSTPTTESPTSSSTQKPKTPGPATTSSGQSGDPATSGETALTPADFVVTEPVRAKIAGTIFEVEPSPITSPEKLGLLSTLFLGGAIVGRVFLRRFRSFHLVQLAPAGDVSYRPVDAVSHRKTRRRKHFQTASRTIR